MRLPILALLLCYMALASLATISYGGMRRIASHGGGIRLRDQGRTVVVHRKDFVFASITGAGAFAGHAVQPHISAGEFQRHSSREVGRLPVRSLQLVCARLYIHPRGQRNMERDTENGR